MTTPGPTPPRRRARFHGGILIHESPLTEFQPIATVRPGSSHGPAMVTVEVIDGFELTATDPDLLDRLAEVLADAAEHLRLTQKLDGAS